MPRQWVPAVKCRKRLQQLGRVQVLETLGGWVDAIPAVTQSLRYGNPAFRTWHARAAAQAPRLLAAVLPPQLAGASQELGLYLSDSLGIARPPARIPLLRDASIETTSRTLAA